MSDTPASRPARRIALTLDRNGHILAGERHGRALWRDHTAELKELVERVLTQGEGALTLATARGEVVLHGAAGQAGNGSPVALLIAHHSGADSSGAHGLLEAEQRQALARLVGGMVHELRNPLASISLTAELLAMRAELSAEVKERLHDLVHHVERAEEVLQTLRRFGKEATASLRIGSLNQLVEDAVRLERSGVAARDVTIRLHLDEAGPMVLADASQLRLVISNLIRNGAEAIASEGRTSGQIVVRTTSRRGVVRLMVEDDGPGIPAEALGRIFQPHFTTKATGTGLGLPMCASIVKAHGGHVWVENRRQRGARFLVDLPDPQHAARAVQPTALGVELTHAPTHAALIIDAGEDRLEDARRAVAAIGYRVHVASDSAVALRKLRAADFDVVVVGHDGEAGRWADLCARVRIAHPEIGERIVVMSDLDLPESEAEVFRRIGARIAVGAFAPGALQALVRSVAEGHKVDAPSDAGVIAS